MNLKGKSIEQLRKLMGQVSLELKRRKNENKLIDFQKHYPKTKGLVNEYVALTKVFHINRGGTDYYFAWLSALSVDIHPIKLKRKDHKDVSAYKAYLNGRIEKFNDKVERKFKGDFYEIDNFYGDLECLGFYGKLMEDFNKVCKCDED